MHFMYGKSSGNASAAIAATKNVFLKEDSQIQENTLSLTDRLRCIKKQDIGRERNAGLMNMGTGYFASG